ncbi:hypothetical protein [Lacinutrix salivirga]
MKQFVLGIMCLFTLFSCSLDDGYNGPSSYSEFIAVTSVAMPEEFELGEVYEIILNYTLPTNCHNFNDIYYVSSSNERKIAIVTSVLNGDNCTPQETEGEISFNFIVNNTGTYIFKFWQGQDSNGQDQYLTMEIPVIE